MRILLPPSEAKASGPRGAPLDLDDLSFPSLNPTRDLVLDALIEASARPDALDVLGAPDSAKRVVAANVDLRTTPTVPVSQLYTGVLYDALDHAALDGPAKRRANARLIVITPLFGALRVTDRVPPYRLSMEVSLPGLGRLTSVWREPLAAALPQEMGTGIVVDLRSSAYAAAWRPTGDLAERTVAVHVVRDTPEGRTAVSHTAKHTRGRVAHHLLTRGADPRAPEELVDAISERFVVAGLSEAQAGKPRRLDVVEPR